MYIATTKLYPELIEERLLQALDRDDVLTYAQLKLRAAASANDASFRRVLNQLIALGLVQRKAARDGLWYIGYSKASARQTSNLDDAPAPFRKLLSELFW